jgi:Cu/Ag efflux protein CusF
MKKGFILLVGIIFVFSLPGWAFAQEKMKSGIKPEEAKSAEPSKPEATNPEAAQKAPPAEPAKYRMGGIITAIDSSAKKITIQQNQLKRERTVTLIMGKEVVKELPDLKVGEAVNVWVIGRTITTLNKIE